MIKMKIRRYIWIVVAVVIVLISVGFRLYPHTLTHVINIEQEELKSMACAAAIAKLDTNGESSIQGYELQSLEKGSSEFEAILGILNDISYQSDYRNLLPWEISNAGGDGSVTISIYLIGKTAEDSCWISFHGEDLVTVTRADETDILVFHATNTKAVDALAEYVKMHGIESE